MIVELYDEHAEAEESEHDVRMDGGTDKRGEAREDRIRDDRIREVNDRAAARAGTHVPERGHPMNACAAPEETKFLSDYTYRTTGGGF